MKITESLKNRKKPLLWKQIFDLGLQKVLAAKFRSLRAQTSEFLRQNSFKNIYGPKSIIFGVYAQVLAYSILLITQPIFIQF